MGNFMTNLKKFFTNRNTVTIIGVIAGVIVLWFFYSYRVRQAIDPQRVPVATREISSLEEITKDDIEFVEVNNKMLKKAKVVVNINELIGKYINIGTSIPEGAMFYRSQVVEKKSLPDAITDEIPDGYTLYQLRVNNDSTFANSILPDNRIDLYLKAKENNKIVFGCLIKSIRVLAVRDSSGQDVFASSTPRTPAWLLFAVPNDMHNLLRTVDFIGDMELFPIPRNRHYTSDGGETEVDSEYLRMLIENRTLPVEDSYTIGE